MQVEWSVQCKSFGSTARAGGGGSTAASGPGGPTASAQTVALLSFSDSPAHFVQAGENGELLQCTAQIETIMDLVGGRYRIMRTVKASGFKLWLGDLEIKVATVPASQRSESAVTLIELTYHPSVYEDECAPVLRAFAEAVLPPGTSDATELLAAPVDPNPDGEFEVRQAVYQYLAALREKKVL